MLSLLFFAIAKLTQLLLAIDQKISKNFDLQKSLFKQTLHPNK